MQTPELRLAMAAQSSEQLMEVTIGSAKQAEHPTNSMLLPLLMRITERLLAQLAKLLEPQTEAPRG
jgi:hypothetical protein